MARKVRLMIDFLTEEALHAHVAMWNLGMIKPTEKVSAFKVDSIDFKNIPQNDTYILKHSDSRPVERMLIETEEDMEGDCLKCGQHRPLFGTVCGDCFTGTVNAENT